LLRWRPKRGSLSERKASENDTWTAENTAFSGFAREINRVKPQETESSL
jgi:hypothetical protein